MKKLFLNISIITITIWPTVFVAQVLTVNGPIAPDDMGITLIHEHVMVDWIGADSTGYHRWNKDEIVKRVLPFLEEAKVQGVQTFIDCTPAYLGRDPHILKKLSDVLGLNILTNTGYYGARNNKYIPKKMLTMTAQQWAEHWSDEFKNGIDSSGIRPGFIKISVEGNENLSQIHERLIRAAAITHLNTGLTIVSHTGPNGPALAQIAILEEMGISHKAFVWTHAQNGTIEGYLKAAELGAWISLDNVSDESEKVSWFVETLGKLKKGEVLDHVLISHDAGWYDVGEQNGGGFRGYTSLFTALIPALKKNGFTEREIEILLIENPKRAYALQIRRL